MSQSTFKGSVIIYHNWKNHKPKITFLELGLLWIRPMMSFDILHQLFYWTYLQASSTIQMVVVLPERDTRATELHRNANIIQSTGEHISTTERHSTCAFSGQSSSLGPYGCIYREEQLCRFTALDTKANSHSVRSTIGSLSNKCIINYTHITLL